MPKYSHAPVCVTMVRMAEFEIRTRELSVIMSFWVGSTFDAIYMTSDTDSNSLLAPTKQIQ